MKFRLKKSLSLLFAGSLSMVLAACYGAPVDMNNTIFLRTVNTENTPIPGLKVTLNQNNTEILTSYTDSSGIVSYPDLNTSYLGYTVDIHDIDSSENLGVFKQKTIEIGPAQTYYSIKMDE